MPKTKSKGILRSVIENEQSQPRARKRGPKPKSIKERTLKDIKPIAYPERSWSQRQRIRVLVFLTHYRIPTGVPGEYRAPSQIEAEDVFGVPQRTISDWVRREKQIEAQGSKTLMRNFRTVTICQWPELESKLYNLFLEHRESGQSIRQGWFRVHADQIFREMYPNVCTTIFRFSAGWFGGFLRRHRVSLRRITKTAQMVPTEYLKLLTSWIRFNRRNSQPLNAIEIALNRAVGRYDLSNIYNVDETPLPFEYLSGRTYNLIGAKTIWVKETKSGWDKRQATLVLCIFADGYNRVPPMIIFHGTGQQLGREHESYHPGVLVEFNETAYMNDILFLKYIELYLIPALQG